MSLIHFEPDLDEIFYESDRFLVGATKGLKRYFCKDNAFNKENEFHKANDNECYNKVGLVELDTCIVQQGMLFLIEELIERGNK